MARKRLGSIRIKYTEVPGNAAPPCETVTVRRYSGGVYNRRRIHPVLAPVGCAGHQMQSRAIVRQAFERGIGGNRAGVWTGT